MCVCVGGGIKYLNQHPACRHLRPHSLGSGSMAGWGFPAYSGNRDIVAVSAHLCCAQCWTRTPPIALSVLRSQLGAQGSPEPQSISVLWSLHPPPSVSHGVASWEACVSHSGDSAGSQDPGEWHSPFPAPSRGCPRVWPGYCSWVLLSAQCPPCPVCLLF